jgi:multiple sugar transport system substrate-binding protein
MIGTVRGTMTRRSVLAGAARGVVGLGVGGGAVALAACGAPTAQEGSVKALPPAELEFIHHWAPTTPGGQGWQAIVGKFQATNPGVTVRQTVQASGGLLDKLVATSAGGTPPTMSDLSPSHYAAAVPKGLLVKMDQFFKSGRGLKKDGLLPSVQDAITLDGSIAALPSQTGARLLYYNADLLNDAGAKPPDTTWKWDKEFLDAARRATRDTGAPETQRFGVDAAPAWPWYLIVWAYGADLISKDRKQCGLAQPAAIEGLQFAADLTHRWRVTPTTPLWRRTRDRSSSRDAKRST